MSTSSQHTPHTADGFAMLFTVLIVSIILSITLGISSVSFKQSILSGMVKDSQTAFYQADSATECALTHEGIVPEVKEGAPQDPGPLECLGATANGELLKQRFVVSNKGARQNYYVYENEMLMGNPSKNVLVPPCFVMVFDKTRESTEQYIIQGYGYNTCNTENPRRLERGIQVTY